MSEKAGSGKGSGNPLGEFLAAMHKPGPRCGVSAIRETLPPERQAALDAALATPTITTTAIRVVLKSWGSDLALSTLLRHRKAECACSR